MQFTDTGENPSQFVEDRSPTSTSVPSHTIDTQVGQHGPNMSQHNPVDINEADLWDPSVLASTNWLDALDGYDFPNFSMLSMPLPMVSGARIGAPADDSSWHEPLSSSQHPPDLLSNARPIDATSSTTSTPTVAENYSSTGDSIYDHESPEAGQFYVDGGPARLPRTKRRKPSSLPVKRSHPSMHTFSLACNYPSDPKGPAIALLDDGRHSVLRDWYERVCLTDHGLYPAFERAVFPPVNVMNGLIDVYFLHFDQVLPFMHRATLPRSGADELLLLAMAAIGSAYLPEDSNSSTFTSSMLEFTRRLMLYREESSESEPDPRTVARVRLLLTVGLMYCGQIEPSKAGIAHARLLIDVHRSAADEFIQLGVPSGQHGNGTEADWLIWCRREAAIRLAHSAWLVDTMLKCHFGIRSGLCKSNPDLPLPCPDSLWNALTAQEWAHTGNGHFAETTSLANALNELYIDKRLPRGRGEFARIIMIHGLFHRFWEVESYYSDPLSSWEPNAARQSSLEVLPHDRIWLPGIKIFRKWENISADAIDVLHWQANATIGQASGLEHSTVLHLHFARIVLLVPHPQILRFAKAWGSGDVRETSDREIVRRWAVQHQYKARLAAIHAGVVLWHIRRYSIDAFYEGPAVALATLTLWAFGTFAAQATKPNSPSSTTSDRGEMEVSNIILLDRPTDDELVQQFIRHDQPFQAHLTGVGDLFDAKGPQRVVFQGCKLLGTLRCWGVVASWMKILEDVSRAY